MLRHDAAGSKLSPLVARAGSGYKQLGAQNINARQPVKLDGPEKGKQRAAYASGGPPGGTVWVVAVGDTSQEE